MRNVFWTRLAGFPFISSDGHPKTRIHNGAMATPRQLLEPDWGIQRAGCYELLTIRNYAGQAATTSYDCLCLRCGSRHILERRMLMRIDASLKARLGRKGIKYWLQIHGNCPECPKDRAPSPAPPEDCISKATFFTFFRHALDARGLRILIASGPFGTIVQIVDSSGNLATLEASGAQGRSEPARMATGTLDPSCLAEDALRSFLEWANRRDYTLVTWSGGRFSLRYAGSFGGPWELRD